MIIITDSSANYSYIASLHNKGAKKMKRVLIGICTFIGIIAMSTTFAADEAMHHGNPHQEMGMIDTRISLGLSSEMKQHQLSNMREHVEAVRSIIGLLSENKFEDAAKIAHAKLGLTPGMQTMCSISSVRQFRQDGYITT